MTSFEERVTASLDRSVKAFNEGKPEFFDEFADEAMIFTVDSPEPIKGREAYRQQYQHALASAQREKTVLDRSVQIVGTKAVVTQTARITQPDATANVRQTIVYGDTGNGCEVLHLHTALLTPMKAGDGVGMDAIRVVNERIAVVPLNPGVAQ